MTSDTHLQNIVVIDPIHFEEAVMGGSMTATLNTNEDVCAIQKAEGVGVLPSVIMQCLHIASVKAGDITSKIKNSIESFNTERSLRKIKRHTSSDVVDVSETAQKVDTEFSTNHMDRLKLLSEDRRVAQSNGMEVDCQISQEGNSKRDSHAKSFSGGPSSWDPYSKGIDTDALRASLASRVIAPTKKPEHSKVDQPIDKELKQPITEDNSYVSPNKVTNAKLQTNGEKTLVDAIKPKHRRRKKASTQQ